MAIKRIGHKGADALVPGNTIASFEKAVEVGVDLIEFDVLWLEDGNPRLAPARRSMTSQSISTSSCPDAKAR